VVFKRCPLCRQRSPKRECPALGQTICAMCCATKRQVEISCPPDCPYLSSARAHPAAAVQRRRERDVRFLLPLIQDLRDTQYRLLLAFQATILKHARSALPSPNDQDVCDAAGTLASTLETARKGIIYEHQTASLPAQRIAGELRALMGQIEREGPVKGLERDAAAVLRRIEQGAREAAAAFAEDGDRAYLALLGRMMADAAADRAADATGDHPNRPGGLVIPG
jgi:hypothetical protein